MLKVKIISNYVNISIKESSRNFPKSYEQSGSQSEEILFSYFEVYSETLMLSHEQVKNILTGFHCMAQINL